MKEIPLSKGMVALVDDEDFDALNEFHWYACKCGTKFYARRKTQTSRAGGQKRKSTAFYMHREIMKFSPDVEHKVDHKDGNGLNNQRHNLRPCTESQNQMNQAVRRTSKSGYRGVSWHTRRKKWRAVIALNGKSLEIGFFTTEEEAAIAYNDKATTLYGEFAALNNVLKF